MYVFTLRELWKSKDIGIYRICRFKAFRFPLFRGHPVHARAHGILQNPREKVDRESEMNPNLEENFIVYSGRACFDSQMRGLLERERWEKGKDEEIALAQLRSYKIEGIGARKGRPKSLNFIASLNGLQSNTCTAGRKIAQPFCSHNFCHWLHIAIIYLK